MIRPLAVAAVASCLIGCPAEKPASAPPPSKTSAKAASQPAKKAGSQPADPHGGEFKDPGPPGEPISGLIKLGEGLTETDVKPTDVLFVMARESHSGGKFGRLVAVQRHAKTKFPKRYELSKSDVMVPGIPFKGPFVVMARLDRDGDPMTKKPEDLYAVFKGDVSSGQEGVHLILTKAQRIQEPKMPPGMKAPPKAPASGPAKAPAKKPSTQPK